jgi:hypothetical protein
MIEMSMRQYSVMIQLTRQEQIMMWLWLAQKIRLFSGAIILQTFYRRQGVGLYGINRIQAILLMPNLHGLLLTKE